MNQVDLSTVVASQTYSGTLSGPGTLQLDGSSVFGTVGLTIENDLIIVDAGSVIQDGLLYLGGSSTIDNSSVIIDSGAVYDVAVGAGLEEASFDDGPPGRGGGGGTFEPGSIINAGLYEFLPNAGYAIPFLINTGTLLADAGSNPFEGPSIGGGTLGGTLAGTGGIFLSGDVTLGPSLVVSVATFDLLGSENVAFTYTLEGNLYIPGSSQITADVLMNGHNLTLAGNALVYEQDFIGNGSAGNTLLVSGYVDMPSDDAIEKNVTLVDAGTIRAEGFLSLGGGSATDNSSLIIQTGAIFDLLDSSVPLAIERLNSGANRLRNAGLLELTGSALGASIDVPIINTGKILVSEGQLTLTEGGTLDGTLAGAGGLDLEGSYTLAPTLLTVATLDLVKGTLTLGADESYAGTLIINAGTSENARAEINLNGHNLTLSGKSFLTGAYFEGPGTLFVTGTASTTMLEDGTSFGTGFVSLVGDTALDTPTLIIGTNGFLEGAVQSSYGTIVNDGTYAAASGDSFYVSTLPYFINNGTLLGGYFNSGGIFGGTLLGDGQVIFASGNVTLLPTLVIDIATVDFGNSTISLENSLNLAGTIGFGVDGTFDLNGHNVTLAGVSELEGVIVGNGSSASELLVTGNETISPYVYRLSNFTDIGNNATLVDTGNITLNVELDLGGYGSNDSSSLTITSGASFVVTGGQPSSGVGSEIYGFTGSNTVSNAGFFEAMSNPDPNGEVSEIEASFSNTGMVLATIGGDLVFDSAVQNNSTFAASGGTLSFNDTTLFGTGTVDIDDGGEVISSSMVAASQTFDFLDGTGTLALIYPSLFASNGHGSLTATIEGLRAGDVLELPGSAVSAISFGTHSLTITTSSGKFDFSNVNYDGVVDGYTMAMDASTGLEAITFTGTVGSPVVTIASGKSASYQMIGNGGSEVVESGATVNVTTITSGGLQDVLAGGVTNYSVVKGGTLNVAGTANRTQLQAGGVETVAAGGTSVGTNVLSGGDENVLSGGTAIDTTIAYFGTLQVSAGGNTSGAINFTGSDAVLSLGGTLLPATQITGFDQNNRHDDAITLTGFTYAAGQDTASLGAGNVLTLDLGGKIEKLNFDPSQSYAGHSFSVTTNSLDQVVVIDPTTGPAPSMDFKAPATAAGSADGVALIPADAGMTDLFAADTSSFKAITTDFIATLKPDMSAALGSSLAALHQPSNILAAITKVIVHQA